MLPSSHTKFLKLIHKVTRGSLRGELTIRSWEQNLCRVSITNNNFSTKSIKTFFLPPNSGSTSEQFLATMSFSAVLSQYILNFVPNGQKSEIIVSKFLLQQLSHKIFLERHECLFFPSIINIFKLRIGCYSAPLYEEDQTPVIIFRLESRRVEGFRGGGGRGRGFQVGVMRMLGTYGVSIKLYRNTTKIIQHYHLPN